MYWYQKEYVFGELRKALNDVSQIFAEGSLSSKAEANDNFCMLVVLRRLCSLVQSSDSPSSLTVKPDGFIWKRGSGEEETYCMCRKMSTGWLFEAGGKGTDAAVHFGWRKLSWDHPLANTEVTVGPSRHLNLCRND